MSETGSSSDSDWIDSVCCPVCGGLFHRIGRWPFSLGCGHTLCHPCILNIPSNNCPFDQLPMTLARDHLTANVALLSVLSDIPTEELRELMRSNGQIIALSLEEDDAELFFETERHLLDMAKYLRRSVSGGAVGIYSQVLSRPAQRKLSELLCFQFLEAEGRLRAVKTARCLSERFLTELLLSHQNSAHLSSNLWSAVRARGCQFLGPAMQEEVLRLILLTLFEGALIARKTLVMYIVQTLQDDYPQVSKTCVGHVVQLLYRASCFNVIKREGESSLMQLKQGFRDYDSLRREHDGQIIQMAMEAGLRISPDQWSALLYGDQHHRNQMQAIIDKLQLPQAFGQSIQELMAVIQRSADSKPLMSTIPNFEMLASVDPQNVSPPSWRNFEAIIRATKELLRDHVGYSSRRSGRRTNGMNATVNRTGLASVRPKYQNRSVMAGSNNVRPCQDPIVIGRPFVHPPHCSFVHSSSEMLNPVVRRPPAPPPTINQPPPNLCFARGMNSVMQQQTVGVMEPRQPSMTIPVGPGIAVVVPPGTPSQQHNLVVQAQQHLIANVSHQSEQPRPPVPPQNGLGPIAAAQGQSSLVPRILSPNQIVNPIIPWVHNLSQPPPPTTSVFIENRKFLLRSSSAECTFSALRNDLSSGLEIANIDDKLGTIKDPGENENGMVICEEEPLKLRRDEIIRRLAALQKTDAEKCWERECSDDDSDDAPAVVSQPKSKDFVREQIHGVELPPFEDRYYNFMTTAVACSLQQTSKMDWWRPYLAGTEPETQTNAAQWPRMKTLPSPSSTTVQAPCSQMKVRDIIQQPVATPSLQPIFGSPLVSLESVDPSQIAWRLPTVMKALPETSHSARNVVTSTLDQIVDVKERLQEVEKKGASSTVERQQLNVELNIAARKIQSLDPETKHTCLLRELDEVDRKIEELSLHGNWFK